MKLIATLQTKKQTATPPTKIENISILELPQLWERKIQQIIYENRALWEPWAESANNFEEIKKRLKDKGYTQLPIGHNPMLNLDARKDHPIANTNSFKAIRTMIRKKA